MGLFENLGRKVEEFKQASEAVAAGEAGYECRNCGERLYADREACPECGSADVVAVEE